MPKVKISEYSATANSNTDVASINIDEGCAPSGINNAIRAIMGHLKDFQQGTNGDPFNGPVNGTVGATTPSTGAFTTVQIGTNPAGVSIGVLGIPNQKRIYGRNAANSADVSILYVDGSNGLVFGPSDAAVINSSGNLGLGVTPSAKLHIYKSSLPAELRIQSGDTQPTISFYSDAVQTPTRNWAISSSFAAYGDLCFLQSTALGGNPITAGTTRMTLDASGNLGIGVTSPTQKLQVAGKIAVSGTNPSIQQTVQNAFLDLCGGTTIGTDPAIQIAGSTTTSDANKIFYNANTHLFRTTSGGTTYATIDTSGNLLVGKTSTADNAVGFLAEKTGRIVASSAASNNADATYVIYSTGASAYRFYVGLGGTVYATSTTITAISDQRLKENIRDLDDGLASVMALKPRKFDWKKGKGANIKDARGFIAQEFETVFPDMIDEWRDPAPEGEEPYKAINANLIPTLVKAIQELKAEFDAYKASHP